MTRAVRAAVVLAATTTALVACALPAACTQRRPDVTAQPQAADVELVSSLQAGEPPPEDGKLSRRVVVEVVWRDADRQRGLGGRHVLGDDAGMLFAYKDDRPRAFWMKDCHIGLDIAYLDAQGVVVKLATLPPRAGAAPGAIPQAPSGKPCRYVLEVNAGWFSRRGLAEGAVVDVSGVVAGIVPE